jgi:hypothetical protein
MARGPVRILLAVALAASTAGALASCSTSRISPTATVHVTGRVLGPGGTPVAGVKVLLLREVDIGQALFGGLIAVGTLSAVCYLPNPPAVCERARQTTTDAHGDYGFTLTGQDTQGSFGTAATMDVVIGPTPASVTVRFTAQRPRVRLPAVRPQRLGAATSINGHVMTVVAGPVPASAGEAPAYGVRFVRDGQLLWSQSLAGRRGRVDTRVLEDQRAEPAIVVDTHLPGGTGAGDVRAEYVGRPLPMLSGPGAPPSRGLPCAPVTGTAPAAAFPTTPCALTDGDLVDDARLTAGSKVADGAVIDLGRSRPVGLVVLRGYAGQVVVELSTDGRRYTTVATLNADGAPIAATIGGRARFVRVRAPSGLDESLAAELSVW